LYYYANDHINAWDIQDKLSDEIKEKVKVGVNRESAEDKIRDFAKWMESVKKEVKHLVSMLDSSY